MRLTSPTTGWWKCLIPYDRLDLVADAGLTIFTYTAEPGSRSEESLRLLGSWAATNEQRNAAGVSHGA